MHRLEHARRRAGRVDVATRREPDATGDGSTEVGEDVAEQVVGHNDVEALRIGDEVNGRRVDVAVIDADAREIGADGLHRAGPEITRMHEHVVLVHQRQLAPGAGGCAGKRVAHHALDTISSVDAFLGGNLVGGALAQEPPGACVGALRAFADHHEVDVCGADTGERTHDTREQLHRTQVHEVVELEPQA